MKNIIIISSSRADHFLLSPIAEQLGTECECIKMRSPTSYAGCADIFSEEDKGKKVVLLGDRWETCLLAFHAIECDCVLLHIHGGEVTAGSKDEIFRHAITKMSHIHLAAHKVFADRIIRMGESPANVFDVGALGVHRAKQITLPKKENKLTVILHPNTIEPGKTESEITTMLNALSAYSNYFRIKFYAPNHDKGRGIIVCKIKAFCELFGGEYIESELGDDFLRSLASSKCIIGNSSCGIIEAPSLKTPTLNIGSRQDGRPRAPSVMQCDFGVEEIKLFVDSALNDTWPDYLFVNPYDNTEHDTVDMICDIIKNHKVDFQKRFFDD